MLLGVASVKPYHSERIGGHAKGRAGLLEPIPPPDSATKSGQESSSMRVPARVSNSRWTTGLEPAVV